MKCKMTKREFTERHAYEIESMLLGRELKRDMEEQDLFRLRSIWCLALNEGEKPARREELKKLKESRYFIPAIARVMRAHKPGADKSFHQWICYEAWVGGVESMLDAYVEGVPFEDIIA